jgi:hypothetical protein
MPSFIAYVQTTSHQRGDPVKDLALNDGNIISSKAVGQHDTIEVVPIILSIWVCIA